MPYIDVPTEDVQTPQTEDITLHEGDYTGEPRQFNPYGEEGERRGLAVTFYSLQNGTGQLIPGRKTYWIVTENPNSAENARIGRIALARLGEALGVTETDETTGTIFVPGDTLEEVAEALSMGTPPGTRLGFRVKNRTWLNADRTPRINPETGEPMFSNEIKSVWRPRA